MFHRVRCAHRNLRSGTTSSAICTKLEVNFVFFAASFQNRISERPLASFEMTGIVVPSEREKSFPKHFHYPWTSVNSCHTSW
jgi:hypothetical protein